MAEVTLRGINKKYPNGYEAVKDANLEIKDQEFMVLVGPSGCGKTTTLRMIAGLEEISSGELFIGEKLVNDIEPKDRDIAMVFQNYALYPHMSVYDNMAFGLKLRKKSKEEIAKMVNKAASILGIESLLNRKPKQLSGGQRQRVALGRAIVRNPKVFLMDEPLSNLDAKLRVQMRSELIKLHRDLKTTFIYVTHDQVEAMTMGTRICVMNEGEIQQVADPNTIYKKPANKFVAGFIGIPQMNFLDGEVIEENKKIYLKVFDVKNLVDENFAQVIKQKGYIHKEVTIGVRPENLQLIPKEESGIDGKIELTENLGSEVYFYINANEHNLIIRVESGIGGEIGDIVKIRLPKENIHLFDKDSGMAILQ